MSDKKSCSIRISRQAKKDIETLSPKLKAKLKDILMEVLVVDPFEGKKLLVDLAGSYSYRLSYQDRIVYSINEKTKTVFIERARTHYGNELPLFRRVSESPAELDTWICPSRQSHFRQDDHGMSLGVREHERAVASSRWPGQAGIPGDTSGTYNQVLFIQGNPSCIGW